MTVVSTIKILFFTLWGAIINAAISVDSPTESSEEFLECMKKNLPLQLVLYLQATGFDTASAFRYFDTSGTESDLLQQVVEMLRTQSVILKSHIPEARAMYGIFYDTPESFIILPGHRSQIMTFVTELRNSSKKQKLEERSLISTSTRKILRRRTETPETPKRSRVLSQLSCMSDSTSSALSASSLESVTKDSEEMEEVMSLSNMPQILQELKTTVTKCLRCNDEFKHLNIEDGKQYSIFVSPTTRNDSIFPITASITCHVCTSKLILPITRSKFRPANFYRHIKSCIIKKSKSLEETQTQSKLTSFIVPSTRKNCQSVIDPDEDDSKETETELATINDHSYGTSVRTNKSSVFKKNEAPDIAAEISVKTVSQASYKTNCEEKL